MDREHRLRPAPRRGIGLIPATLDMKQRPNDYCKINHIFPGGYIPSLARTLIFINKDGVNVQAIDNLSVPLPPHVGAVAEKP